MDGFFLWKDLLVYFFNYLHLVEENSYDTGCMDNSFVVSLHNPSVFNELYARVVDT